MNYSFKYYTTPNKVKDTIEKYGVAIIPRLLNDDECRNAINGMWDTFEYLTKNSEIPVKRDDLSTWKKTFDLSPSMGMIYGHYGIGHSQFIWDIRQNIKCVNVFSKLWNSEDLICSFDGFAFHAPTEITGVDVSHYGKWFHTDQSYTRDYFDGVQSWITLYDIERGDATLSFLEKSHLFQKEIKDIFNKSSQNDWNLLTKEEIDVYKYYGCEEVAISCPAGSIVLWDSRVIHYGKHPEVNRIHPKNRAVVYLNYVPKEGVSEEVLGLRRDFFKDKLIASHYPHKRVYRHYLPRTINIDYIVPELQLPRLTNLGKKIIG
jgi:hypothetical protein